MGQENNGEFVFLLKGRGNIFWKTIREGVEDAGREAKLRVSVLHTDDDQTPESQLNMCLAAIVRKPRAIIMGAATKSVGIECFRKASALGILTADIDGNVTSEDAHNEHIPLSFSVGSDNVLIGKLAGEYLAQVTKNPSPKVLLIKGLPGSIVSEKRAKGFIDSLKRLLPAAQIIATPSADWDRMKGMNIALDFMQRDAALDYIFSVSDVMTMGVIEGVKVARKGDSVKVISVDGIADARKAVLDGRMMANVAQLPYLMGRRAVELAIKATHEKLFGYSEYTPTPILTKEILEKNEDPDLQYLR